MARKHVIKYYARLIQKKVFEEKDLPEDIREEVMNLSVTLPLREDMKKTEDDTTITKPTETE